MTTPNSASDFDPASNSFDSDLPSSPGGQNIPGAPLDQNGPPVNDEGRRTHPLSGLVLGLVWGVGVALAFGFGSLRDGEWLVALASVPAGFLTGVAAGYVRWWFTKYFINETEIRIETGPIFRSSRRIPFARLQSIDINQPLVARIFQLSELTIEMAGGSDSSSKLRFLPLAEARVIRATVLQRSRALTKSKSPSSSGKVAPAGPETEATLASQPDAEFSLDENLSIMTRVTPDRLLLGALLSLDLIVGIIAALGLAIGFIVFDIPWALFGVGIPVAFGVFSIISSRVFAQWDFTLSRTDDGLRITRGLFDRSSQTIPFDRIQGLELVEPYFWRKLGWGRLEIDVAGYGIVSSEDGVSATTLLPISDLPLAKALMAALVPDPNPEQHEAAFYQASRRGRIFAPIGWRYRWLSRSQNTVLTHTGWLTERTQIIPQAKVQSVAIDQGPWQHYLGVATVSIHTPDGPVSIEIRHLDSELAPDLLRAEIEQTRHAVLQPVSLANFLSLTHTPRSSGSVESTEHQSGQPTSNFESEPND